MSEYNPESWKGWLDAITNKEESRIWKVEINYRLGNHSAYVDVHKYDSDGARTQQTLMISPAQIVELAEALKVTGPQRAV